MSLRQDALKTFWGQKIQPVGRQNETKAPSLKRAPIARVTLTELLCCCPFMSVFVFLFMLLHILSGREERDALVGIENPAFDAGRSTALSVPPVWTGREIRGDRPDSTLAAHRKKMELQAPAKERGEASFFIRLKFVDSRCVPDLTFLSLPLSFAPFIRGALGPCIPKQACPNKQPSYKFLPPLLENAAVVGVLSLSRSTLDTISLDSHSRLHALWWAGVIGECIYIRYYATKPIRCLCGVLTTPPKHGWRPIRHTNMPPYNSVCQGELLRNGMAN